jgi:hypothetical protein
MWRGNKKPGAKATGLKMRFSFRNRNSRVVIWYYSITEKAGAWYLVVIAEYQDKIKLKFSAFLRQHSSCVPLSGILKKVVIN